MKAFLPGSNPSIRVPVRTITLSNGETLRLYDTSGPYTDPEYAVDLKQGLPPLRRHWILERDDVEPGAGGRWGLKAKRGRTVTQGGDTAKLVPRLDRPHMNVVSMKMVSTSCSPTR